MLRLDEVEAGHKYDLYITTSAGLYRFRSNLSLEIVSMEADHVIVRF
ncbi:GH3 auxin-responsive promoter family protein [Butyrivibrio sp.]